MSHDAGRRSKTPSPRAILAAKARKDPRPLASASAAKGKPSRPVSLALVQFATRKADLEANVGRMGAAFAALRKSDQRLPDVVVFPETALSGYFVEGGVRDVALPARAALQRINAAFKEAAGDARCDIVFGFYEDDAGKLYNSAMYATLGTKPRIVHVHRKMFLPTYGIFDEERFISRGNAIDVFATAYGRAAILICEDACHALATTVAALRGAQIIFIPSASPGRGLEQGEPANVRAWREIMRVTAAEHGILIAYAGLLGFEGGKGFTGASRLVGPFGDLRAEAPFAGEAILQAPISMHDVTAARAGLPMLGDLEANLAELSAMISQCAIPARR